MHTRGCTQYVVPHMKNAVWPCETLALGWPYVTLTLGWPSPYVALGPDSWFAARLIVIIIILKVLVG